MRNDIDLVDQCSKIYLQHACFPYTGTSDDCQGLKRSFRGIKETNHTRRFQTLRDELKKYCHAIDFNEAVALSKLRALLEEARLSKAEETARITALWDRLTFSKQSGKQVDLRATIFGCLATEAEIAADKLVRRYE